MVFSALHLERAPPSFACNCFKFSDRRKDMDYRKMYVRLKKDGESEEKIKEYKRFLDREKKRCKRDREAKQAAGIVFNSLDALTGNDVEHEFDIPDPSQDVLEQIVHNDDLEMLRKCLRNLSQDERHLLDVYFGAEDEVAAQAANTLGIPVSTFKDRKNRILKKIRKEFFEKEG